MVRWVIWWGSVMSFQLNTRCCSRYGETSPYHFWKRKFSIPGKTVYSAWKYLTLRVKFHIPRGKFQNPHPTVARFKFTKPRKAFSCQILYSLGADESQASQLHSLVGARSDHSAKNGLLNSLNISNVSPQGTGPSISKMVSHSNISCLLLCFILISGHETLHLK